MNPEVIQTNDLYAITLEFASGLVGAPFFDAINRIVKQESARIHLTTSQKIMILDLSKDSARRAREILDELGADYKFPKQVYQPRVCVGSAYCKLGLADTLRFGERIYESFAHFDIPFKIKIGVSGCPASCAHSTFADIGFIARKSGYRVYVGGKTGTNPRTGQLLAKSVTEDNAMEILNNVIHLYCKECDLGQTRPRVFHTIEKMGFDEFKTRVISYE